jgi:hypothetical protein
MNGDTSSRRADTDLANFCAAAAVNDCGRRQHARERSKISRPVGFRLNRKTAAASRMNSELSAAARPLLAPTETTFAGWPSPDYGYASKSTMWPQMSRYSATRDRPTHRHEP